MWYNELVEVTTIKKTTYRLSAEDIFNALREIKRIREEVEFSIYVDVPSGGDYSGQRLYIDKETPLIIEVTETSKK